MAVFINTFLKGIKVQILLSFLLIIFAVVAVYAMRIANLGLATSAYTDDKPSFGKTGTSKTATIRKPKARNSSKVQPDRNDELYDYISVPKPAPLQPKNHHPQKAQDDLTKMLEKLKYDGYMLIGNAKFAWLFDGKKRALVNEGSIFDDTIKIEEIQENFLSVSAGDNHIVRSIPFVQNFDEKVLKTSAQVGSIASATSPDKSGSSINKTALTRSLLTSISPPQNRSSRIANNSSNFISSPSFELPPQIPTEDAPPMPW